MAKNEERKTTTSFIIWPLLAGAAATILLARRAAAAQNATLFGKVYDATSDPLNPTYIPGIVVSVNGHTAQTGADGAYRITEIPPGNYTIDFVDPEGRYQSALDV